VRFILEAAVSINVRSDDLVIAMSMVVHEALAEHFCRTGIS
jgi:hypothetical protein